MRGRGSLSYKKFLKKSQEIQGWEVGVFETEVILEDSFPVVVVQF